MSGQLPAMSGAVTFLFSDIAGSTRLWELYPAEMRAALARHDEILRNEIERQNGRVVKTTGDGVHAVFEKAQEACLAAIAAQCGLIQEDWPTEEPLTVRIGIHTGEAESREGDYYGPALNRAARLMAAAHGGQVLVTRLTAELVQDQLPPELSLLDCGEHRLKDLSRPDRIYQLAAAGLPVDFPPLRTLEAVPNNLPYQLTSFIGREGEKAQAGKLLAEARLLTLVGPGGTGKSRLALQLAGEVLGDYPDGVWLAELAAISDPAYIVPTIAGLIGLHEIPNLPLKDALTSYLRERRALILLDNCEHLIEACAGLAAHLLSACPRLKILASSREGLGVPGEMVYRVPSLSIPDLGEAGAGGAAAGGSAAGGGEPRLDELAAYEAVQLFVERAREYQPQYALNPGNAAAIAKIACRLDGIPLALELAAARTRMFSAAQIAERLDDRFRLLTGGSRTALPRQQTLRALIDWSYELLSEPERSLLQRLAVFAGGWTIEAAEAVCSGLEVWDLLERLVDKSLVMVDRRRRGVRYYLLETIRQYSRDRLFEAGEAEAARDQHLAYFAAFTAEAERQTHGGWVFIGDSSPDWVDRIAAELDNLRSALEWGLEADPEAALQLAGDSAPLISYQGHMVEMRSWLEAALKRVQALPEAEGAALERRRRALSKAHFELGVADFGVGNLPQARLDFDQAITMHAGQPVDYRLIRALAWRAFTAANQGDPAAREPGSEGLRLAKQTGDLYAVNLSLSALEILALLQGEMELSKSYQREREEIAQGDPNQAAYVMVFFATAMTARARGEYELARDNFLKCLPLFRQQKNRFFETVVLSELGHMARLMGDLDEAQRAYCETMRLWKDLGHLAALTHQLETAAFIDIERGDPGGAARLLGAAERQREIFKSEMRPYERQDYDAALESLRARLDPGELAARWREGRRLELDEAVQIVIDTQCA